MNRYEVCRHDEVPFEVLQCIVCGEAFRCCPGCPGNRSLCLDCEAGQPCGHHAAAIVQTAEGTAYCGECEAAAAGSGGDRREGGR